MKILVVLIIAWSIVDINCICDPGHYLNTTISPPGCKRCPKGTYKPQPGDNMTCIMCPPTKDGYKRTTLISGTTNVEKCYSSPVVKSINPSYGPVSGGTVVQLFLDYWEKFNVSYVYLGPVKCTVIHQNTKNNTVQFITGPAPQVMTKIAKVTFKIDIMIKSQMQFEYKPDPIVYGLDDYKTIVSGGLLIKVFGDNFTSVAHIYFTVTRIHKGEMRKFSEPCKIMNSSLLHCRTPNVGYGMVHHLFSNRKKRDVSSPPTINDKDNQFYAGLSMDGVNTYNNLSDTFSHYGELLVYPDPVFYQFEEKDRVRKFDPEIKAFLDILGRHINYAITKEDLTVTVGLSRCNVTDLATNQLTCQPPPKKPNISVAKFGPRKTPRVTVFVGNLIYVIGYLDYSSDVINEVILGVIIGCCFLSFLLLIIIIAAVCRRKKKKEGFKDINANVATNEVVITSKIKKKRYVDAPGLPQTVNVAYAQAQEGSQNSGFQPYGETIPQARGREMSWTISPPGTPGSCTATSDSNSTHPLYFNYNNEDTEKENDVLNELDESLMLNVKECLLKNDNLDIQDVIGHGYFGKVHKGILKTDEINERIVAVKTIQGNHFTTKEVGAFLEEAVLMKDFSHNNVLSLIGVVISNNRPFVVLPMMEYGDLKTYIRDPEKRIKVKELLGFGLQVAGGMSYLARQKFVHRDLATRNCMLNKDMVVKIADFGLSRDVYNCDYYRIEDKHRALPVRWMAIESLTSGIFSSKSDVWSFGVTLWELLTRGVSPYPDVDTFNIKAYVMSGRRLSCPDHVPDEIFSIMKRCWAEDPDERPTFDEIHNDIDDILSADTNSRRPDYAKLVLVS